MAEKTEELAWFTLFKERAPAKDVATAWYESHDDEGKKLAKGDAPTSRGKLRRALVDSDCPEVRSDAASGWKYTGSVMRALDEVLGVPPPKPHSRGGDLRDGDGGVPFRPKLVCEASGAPGTLCLWWSDYDTAKQAKKLREKHGITHRLNLAIEVVGKFAAEDDEFVKTVHVPMEDCFNPEEELCEDWPNQFRKILEILRAWRDEGVIANINCQMGKNRSGAAVLLWLCEECGWTLDAAVPHLRSITALACANPHLLAALSKVLKTNEVIPLNPAADGGGWVCISPPGSPRQGAANEFDRGFEKGGLSEAANRLAAMNVTSPLDEQDEEEEDEGEIAAGDIEPLFSGLDDVDD